MRAVTIKCPECGAVVNAKLTDASARCEYCGVTSQIRGRSRVLQIPKPMPAASAGAPRMPVATVNRSKAGCLPGIVVLGVMAGIAVPIVIAVRGNSCQPAAVQKLRRAQWDGSSRPVIMDVNGDGTEDIIGRVRVLQPTDIVKLAAYDHDGKRLWISDTLGPRGDWYNGPMGVTGGTIVLGDGKAGLIGLAVADGGTKWTIRVNEVVKKICAGESEGSLTIFTADDKAHALSVGDGAVVPSSATGCRPVPTDDERGDSPEVVQWNWHNGHRELAIEDTVEGMYSREALHYVPGNISIALGHKKPGSQVPMLAAYRWPEDSLAAQAARVAELQERMQTEKDPARRRAVITDFMEARAALRELEGGRKPDVRWTAVVPGVDPLTAEPRAPEPEHVAIGGEHVVVVYPMKDGAHSYRIAAFRLIDGTRAWDVGLEGDSPMSAIAASSTHALVSRWDGLTAYDLADGRRAFTIE